MISYKELNVNPKGRKTGDCSTRALANILNISYGEALDLQCASAKKHCYGLTNKETIDWVLKDFGYVKVKQPRKANKSKYQVNEIDEILTRKEMEDGVIILVANHWTIVRKGYIEDIWNCGRKSIGNYWVKVVK